MGEQSQDGETDGAPLPAVGTASWESFELQVRNELTGVVHTLTLNAPNSGAAQAMAVTQMFREHGWRKVCAMPPLYAGSAIRPT